jgi:superoxide reductase
MSSRREVLTTTLVVASGVAIARSAPALAGSSSALPAGLIYTVGNPGMWSKKVGGHAPLVSIEGDEATITTKHSMSEKHYIVRHTLVAADGTVISAKTFYPSDEEPVSSHPLPAGAKGRFYATSFCNKHDFWVTEFNV